MPGDGIPLGDILDDSGYAHRDAEAWAIPLRQAGAQLIQDLHPSGRGPKGTHHGAIIANGYLYCPVTPRPLLELGPLARDATPAETAAHDTQAAELARYKLGRITADDADGYHRVMCPAVVGKIRCPLRPASMTLDRQRPEILTPPEHPPDCCPRQTLTVPPEVAAKTRQKHDYPSQRTGGPRPAHRRRADLLHRQGPRQQQHRPRLVPAMGLAPLMLWLACLIAVRNQRILTAWDRPPGRQRPPRRGRPPAPDPPPAPQDPRQPRRHRSTAITPSAPGPATGHRHAQNTPANARRSGPAAPASRISQAIWIAPASAQNTPATDENVRPKREHGPH